MNGIAVRNFVLVSRDPFYPRFDQRRLLISIILLLEIVKLPCKFSNPSWMSKDGFCIIIFQKRIELRSELHSTAAEQVREHKESNFLGFPAKHLENDGTIHFLSGWRHSCGSISK